MLKSHCSFFPLLLFKRRLPANDGRRKKEEEGKKAGTLRTVGRRRGKRGLLPLLPIISEEEEEEGGEEGVYGFSVCVCAGLFNAEKCIHMRGDKEILVSSFISVSFYFLGLR